GLMGELGRFSPKEIIVHPNFNENAVLKKLIHDKLECCVTTAQAEWFSENVASEMVKNHFKILSSEDIGIKEKSA
ncbi:MAG: hypothetical protein RR177_06280, partial [Oscillospiraceae bacterium]